jgi:hypothetical protein
MTPRKRLLAAFLVVVSSPALADIPQNDDVIINGSLNVGLDSVNNRNFGFDTIILSENNLRMLFEDTSTTSSFPSNDWRIVVNDTTNGGDDHFSIEDVTGGRIPFRIDAGAPTSSLHVDSQGDVGIGTNNPLLELHVADGDSPSLRLEQNGTSGWTPQTWDVAGNETNFFIRDVTNGSKLPFRIRPGAPTDSLRIESSGNLGIGISNPKSKMHVRVRNSTGEGDPGENVFVGPDSTADSELTSTFNVQGTAFISETLEIGSSRTRKEQIRELTLDEARAALEELEPVEFHYKQDPESQLGFIAEDVPEIVATEGRRSVRPMDFVAVLAKVVQNHEQRERELSETIAEQQREIALLGERLSLLEQASPPVAGSGSVDESPER